MVAHISSAETGTPAMRTAIQTIFLGLLGFSSALAENVHLSAGFETGRIQSASGNVDAFFVMTLPNPQNGSESIKTGSGGGQPSSNWDSKVVREENRGQQILPRSGNYFARSMIYANKDYTDLNDGLHKPRNALSLTAQEHRFDFDKEGWMGVSVFVPKDFEDEVGNRGSPGSIEVIVSNTDSAAYFFNINIFVPDGESESHWMLQYVVDDENVEGQPGGRRNVSLGPVRYDKGKWTDFVIRYRANPFSVDTNPANLGIPGAKNRLYRANKGILQIWKSKGPVLASGDREMVRKFSILNKPVGQVPGTVQGKSLLHFALRVYKYGWQREPSSVQGPIWLGFDEFRYGLAGRDGTSYRDVHPTGQGCTDKCPSGTEAGLAPPRSPTGLNIT